MTKFILFAALCFPLASFASENPLVRSLIDHDTKQTRFILTAGNSEQCGGWTDINVSGKGSIQEIRLGLSQSYFYANLNKQDADMKAKGDARMKGTASQRTSGEILTLGTTYTDDMVNMAFYETLVYDRANQTLAYAEMLDQNVVNNCIYKAATK